MKAIAIRLEAIASRVEAIALKMWLNSWELSITSQHFALTPVPAFLLAAHVET